MQKPILFLTSSDFLQIENLYYLRDIGTVLNFADTKVKESDVVQYMNKQFIICNVKEEREVALLRFVNMDTVYRVAVIRKSESCKEPWIEKLQPDFTIKNFDFVQQVSNAVELWNYIKHLSMFKKPDSDGVFWGKKAWRFLTVCFSKGD